MQEHSRLGGVQFYVLLCEQVLGRRPVSVRLLDLKEPVVIAADPSEQALRGLRQRTSAVWSAIEGPARTRTSGRSRRGCANGAAFRRTVPLSAVTRPGPAHGHACLPSQSDRAVPSRLTCGMSWAVVDAVDAGGPGLALAGAGGGRCPGLRRIGSRRPRADLVLIGVVRGRRPGPGGRRRRWAVVFSGAVTPVVNAGGQGARSDGAGPTEGRRSAPVRDPRSTSFPSGHALAAWCAATLLADGTPGPRLLPGGRGRVAQPDPSAPAPHHRRPGRGRPRDGLGRLGRLVAPGGGDGGGRGMGGAGRG